MIRFASPAWLSVFALQCAGEDPDLPKGVHVRLLPSPLLGLPIAPWQIWQVPVGVTTFEIARTVRLTPSVLPLEPSPDEVDVLRYVAAEARAAGGTGRLAISLYDPDGGALLSRRSDAAYVVGGPVVRRVGVGSLRFGATVRAYSIHGKSADRIREEKPIATLALPIPGRCRWYYGGISPQDGLERVGRGAPLRFSVLDKPDGVLGALTPDDEIARIAASQGELDAALEAVVRDPAGAPWDVTLEVPSQGFAGEPPQKALVPQLESLLMPMCDPGVARYLGFADEIGKTIRPELANPLIGLVAAGLFAVDPARVIAQRQFGAFTLTERLGDRLPPPDADEQDMAAYVLALTGAEDVAAKLADAGYQIRCFLAPAAAVPPPDPLAAPNVTLGDARWIAAPEGVSTSFRQGFRFTVPPFAPLLAMARDIGEGFEPRARAVETSRGPRRAPLLIGENDAGHGIASDAPIPDDTAVRYRFQVGDLFGRYGRAADVDVPEPPRPAPPAPVPSPAVRRVALNDQAPGALSPGTLEVRIPVPDDASIGIGGRPLAALILGFAGETRTIAVTPGERVMASFTVPALLPEQAGTWPLTAQFVDDRGTASPLATRTIHVGDGRRPKPVPAGPGIIWTSRPGPSPDVELRLSWPAAHGQAYRAYLADQRGLGLAAAPTRAAVALDGFTKQQQGQLNGLGERFRLLTDAPVSADADGRARLHATLPRALQTVSFLRIVPVTSGGVAADFDACPLVPVAVPDDHPAPIPRLTVSTDVTGRPVVTIEAVGFDTAALAAREPGLFTEPPTPANPPQYRLRRASGDVKDPLYARFVQGPAPLPLDRSGTTPAFRIRLTETAGLLPFVRYTWWAEVRLPAERRLPRGAVALPLPAAVTAENAAQLQDAPAPFSPLSSPATLVNAPPGPPAALDPAAISASIVPSGGGLALHLSIATVPIAHPRAVGRYRIAIWTEQAGGAPLLRTDPAVETTALPFIWDGSLAGGGAVKAYVVVIDPLGRASAAAVKEVTA